MTFSKQYVTMSLFGLAVVTRGDAKAQANIRSCINHGQNIDTRHKTGGEASVVSF